MTTSDSKDVMEKKRRVCCVLRCWICSGPSFGPCMSSRCFSKWGSFKVRPLKGGTPLQLVLFSFCMLPMRFLSQFFTLQHYTRSKFPSGRADCKTRLLHTEWCAAGSPKGPAQCHALQALRSKTTKWKRHESTSFKICFVAFLCCGLFQVVSKLVIIGVRRFGGTLQGLSLGQFLRVLGGSNNTRWTCVLGSRFQDR